MEFLDRLPIPNLRVYTAVSFAVLSCSVYYAAQIIKDPAWKSNHTYVEPDNVITGDFESDPRNLGMHLKELLECMLDEPICIWVSGSTCSLPIGTYSYTELRIHFQGFRNSQFNPRHLLVLAALQIYVSRNDSFRFAAMLTWKMCRLMASTFGI